MKETAGLRSAVLQPSVPLGTSTIPAQRASCRSEEENEGQRILGPLGSPAKYERCLCIQTLTTHTSQVRRLATKWAAMISLLNNNLVLKFVAFSVASYPQKSPGVCDSLYRAIG